LKRVTIIDASDEFDGGDVLPGLRLRLADLFPRKDPAD
jgi:hypothetical protein